MKKYLIGLVKSDLQQNKSYLSSCERVLKAHTEDQFWLRKKQSITKKIERAEKLLEQMEQSEIRLVVLNSDQNVKVSDTTEAK